MVVMSTWELDVRVGGLWKTPATKLLGAVGKGNVVCMCTCQELQREGHGNEEHVQRQRSRKLQQRIAFKHLDAGHVHVSGI